MKQIGLGLILYVGDHDSYPFWLTHLDGSSIGTNGYHCIAIGDTGHSISQGLFAVTKWSPPKSLARIRPAHGTRMNTVFCDGHVEFNRAVKLFEPTESARRRWNYDNEPHPETWDKR